MHTVWSKQGTVGRPGSMAHKRDRLVLVLLESVSIAGAGIMFLFTSPRNISGESDTHNVVIHDKCALTQRHSL